MNRIASFLIASLAVILLLVLGFVFVLMLGDELDLGAISGSTSTPAEIAASTATPITTPPPPVVVVLPTDTALPTNTSVPPTDTPLPTDTTVPTAAPTNTPVPVVVNPPTSIPVPPTNTPGAPPPPPPPQDARGLVATHFGLQDRSEFAVNKHIWFDFSITNTTGGDVPYSRLGVLPKKDGVDRFDWFQQSYGGPNAAIRPGGLTHEDNIKLPEAGNYTLRLAICFDGYDACSSSGGNWSTLSHEIQVTIN
jgi:hypothetical protein